MDGNFKIARVEDNDAKMLTDMRASLASLAENVRPKLMLSLGGWSMSRSDGPVFGECRHTCTLQMVFVMTLLSMSQTCVRLVDGHDVPLLQICVLRCHPCSRLMPSGGLPLLDCMTESAA